MPRRLQARHLLGHLYLLQLWRDVRAMTVWMPRMTCAWRSVLARARMPLQNAPRTPGGLDPVGRPGTSRRAGMLRRLWGGNASAVSDGQRGKPVIGRFALLACSDKAFEVTDTDEHPPSDPHDRQFARLPCPSERASMNAQKIGRGVDGQEPLTLLSSARSRSCGRRRRSPNEREFTA
jgi:hypothetical protein